ncbi:hypothetical protein Dda_8231 [Drechslerella dactyloides]|uniref:Uncharacterized protein n=1 Tax=Drechslerella dactyloides TaxID=74499 RepID=A0AAD6IS06_DREDA|nr:hypothetical protein Dda_8231 [Drechslerella dactyloides]
MKFSLVTVLAVLTAVASAAPIQLSSPEKCALAKHKFSPLLNHFCQLNCKNCVSMKLDCEELKKDCDFPREIDLRALAEEIDI